jgi:DUF1680 family protein
MKNFKLVFAVCFIGSMTMPTRADMITEQPGYLRGELIYPLDDRPIPSCHASTLVQAADGTLVAAVKRGPVVYCLESTDLPEGVDIMGVVIPSDIKLSTVYDKRLLGGVVIIEGMAEAISSGDWSNQLYRELQPGPSKPFLMRLVPYFAWDNRGESEMTVWIPLKTF